MLSALILNGFENKMSISGLKLNCHFGSKASFCLLDRLLKNKTICSGLIHPLQQ
jgi:hypothetical protein